MSDTNILDAMREHLALCPQLAGVRIGADHLGAEVGSVCVEALPTQPVTARYMDGSSLRQALFAVSARVAWGDDIAANTRNMERFGRIADWIDLCGRSGALPVLGEGETALGLKVTSSGYIMEQTGSTARCQLQARLTYFKKKES